MDDRNDFIEDSLEWINDQLKDMGLEFAFDGYGEGGFDDDNGWDYEDVYYYVTINGNEEKICFECCDNDEGSVFVYREGSDEYQTWVEFMNSINGNDSDFQESVELLKRNGFIIEEGKSNKGKSDRFEHKKKLSGKKCCCGKKNCKCEDDDELDESISLLKKTGYIIKEGLDIDLEDKDRSMTAILKKNLAVINACKTAKEVGLVVSNILAKEGLDTPATRRLLMNIGKKRRLEDAWSVVYNSFLKGANLGVV